MRFLILFVICLSVNDCMEKAEKAFSVVGSSMYIQAAQVYATQQLAESLKK